MSRELNFTGTSWCLKTGTYLFRSSPLKALVTTVLFWTQTRSSKPALRSATIAPSSCQGVVFAEGKGKCQEMLSLRMVVADGSRCCVTSEVHQPLVVFEGGLRLGPQHRHLRARGHPVRPPFKLRSGRRCQRAPSARNLIRPPVRG